MQMRSAIVAAVIATARAGSVGAQAAPATAPTPTYPAPMGPKLVASTAGECVKSGSGWYTSALTAMPRAEMLARRIAFYNEQKRIIKECGAQFSVEATAPADLPGLTDYYNFVADTASARLSLDRSLEAKGLSDRARATVLRQAMTREIGRSTVFGILDDAEAYVTRIDALPDSMIDQKIAAHQTMMGRYDYLDVADGLANHANALIRMGRQANKPAVLVSAFASLARSSADKLHPDVALKILDDAEKEIGSAVVKESYKDFRERYALIGTHAPTVTGKWWVNSPADLEAVTPGNGKVTMVEFTAHWCGPCKNSYPGIKTVARHFAGKPFQGVMATGLYGFIGTRRPLTHEEEVAADNDYFGKEHALPFPVAINENGPVEKPGDFGPMLDRSYRVGGIPQIMIIDRKGVIRQIVTGWDQGNTDRFMKYIETLLAEK